MRKNLCVGILRENRESEKRAPLTPSDVNWLIKRKIPVEVESDPNRIFGDKAYKKVGAKVPNKLQKATLLVGIKAPLLEEIYPNTIYMTFSHTIKGQTQNAPFLKACLKNGITLIDYEKIVDAHGRRLTYFGRFAGICGLIDSLHYLGEKLEWKGIKNPFLLIQPAYKYNSLKDIKLVMAKLDHEIRTKGFGSDLSPLIIGITGHGNVSRGVQEALGLLGSVEIHPRDMPRFIKRQKRMHKKIYKIVFLREEKFRAKDGKGFYFEGYLQYPDRFESNLDIYLPYLNALIHTSYWDRRYPRIVTKKMVNSLCRKKPFRLEFIGDISCDINGGIELTRKTTTQENPTYTYDPKSRKFFNGHAHEGITIFAIDNLPSELPKDASRKFSGLIRDYVYQIAVHGVRDLTHHAAIPTEVRRAVIVQGGKLTKDFRYLAKWVQ